MEKKQNSKGIIIIFALLYLLSRLVYFIFALSFGFLFGDVILMVVILVIACCYSTSNNRERKGMSIEEYEQELIDLEKEEEERQDIENLNPFPRSKKKKINSGKKYLDLSVEHVCFR